MGFAVRDILYSHPILNKAVYHWAMKFLVRDSIVNVNQTARRRAKSALQHANGEPNPLRRRTATHIRTESTEEQDMEAARNNSEEDVVPNDSDGEATHARAVTVRKKNKGTKANAAPTHGLALRNTIPPARSIPQKTATANQVPVSNPSTTNARPTAAFNKLKKPITK